jgi:Fe2+ or Zn2+ uptake regulation protein
MTFAAKASEAIRETGGRMTPQRRLIIELMEGAEGHLDAEGLYHLAHERDESISLATVYRTLNVLKDAGLVQQRYFSRDHGREYYEPAQSKEHYHFTCSTCGQVTEFETALVDEITQQLEARLSMMVKHACVCFEGICQTCQADIAGEEAA